MRGLRYVVFFLLLIGVGCTTPSATIALIEQSERVAIDYPDSALMLISHVDPDCVYGKRDKAHYRLAYSEALYYNQENMDCDSLTRPLFDYYYDSDNHAERARAMYQHGRVMYTTGNHPEAMYALLEAEKSLQYSDNIRLEAMVYLVMGNIYGSECLYLNALDAYKKSYYIFEKLKLDYHTVFTLHNIAEILYSIKEYDSAEAYLLQTIDIADRQGFNELLSYALYSLCDIYVYTGRASQLGQYLTKFDTGKYPIPFPLSYYYYNAIYQSSLGNRDKAIQLMETADSYPNEELANIEQYKYYIYNLLNDNKQALYWMSKYIDRQEELLLSVLELPILNTQIDLLKRDIDIARERTQYVKYRNIFVFLLLLIIAITIALYIRHRMIMQRHEIEMYISLVGELRQSYENSSSKILEDVQSVYENQLADLNTLFEAYYEHGNTPRASYKIVERVKYMVDSMRNDSDSITQLERVVNLQHNNVVMYIKESNIRFSDKELRYIIYVLSGLSNRSMCLLLDIDDAALYRIKYKVKNKMIEAGLDNEIIKMLLRR